MFFKSFIKVLLLFLVKMFLEFEGIIRFFCCCFVVVYFIWNLLIWLRVLWVCKVLCNGVKLIWFFLLLIMLNLLFLLKISLMVEFNLKFFRYLLILVCFFCFFCCCCVVKKVILLRSWDFFWIFRNYLFKFVMMDLEIVFWDVGIDCWIMLVSLYWVVYLFWMVGIKCLFCRFFNDLRVWWYFFFWISLCVLLIVCNILSDFFRVFDIFVIFCLILCVLISVCFCLVNFLVLVWMDWLRFKILVVKVIVFLCIFCSWLMDFRNFLCFVNLICLMLFLWFLVYCDKFWVRDLIWLFVVVFFNIGISWLRKFELEGVRMIYKRS